jgi:hypothetical protein
MSQIDDCITAFDKTLSDLLKQGKDPTFIIASLSEIILKAVKADPEHGPIALDSLVSVLDASAQAMRGKIVKNLAQAMFGDRLD